MVGWTDRWTSTFHSPSPIDIPILINISLRCSCNRGIMEAKIRKWLSESRWSTVRAKQEIAQCLNGFKRMFPASPPQPLGSCSNKLSAYSSSAALISISPWRHRASKAANTIGLSNPQQFGASPWEYWEEAAWKAKETGDPPTALRHEWVRNTL